MKRVIHPYIPNSVPEVHAEMLRAVGVADVAELFREIPEHLRCAEALDIPAALTSEVELKSHMVEILSQNTSCADYLNFLGGGCYQHHVPAVVDAIISRGELLTAYHGTCYSDQGRFQIYFEYVSMLTDLLGMEIGSFPHYDGVSASSTAIRMSARITGRSQVLVPETIDRQRLRHMRNYCRGADVEQIRTVRCDPQTGLLDLADLEDKLGSDTAGVFVENPSSLGIIESQVQQISDLAHSAGALLVACVNPMSLGIIAAPGDYGADIACGDAQPLGVHMNAGGGGTGFVATMDIPEHIAEHPNLMVSILDMEDGGDGFGFTFLAYPKRLSYWGRDHAKEYTGTNCGLWSIANAVYLAVMGPQGMRDIGETILKKSHYAKKLLSKIDGVELPYSATHFNEFVVNFDRTGKTVAEINAALLEKKIFGGKDLSNEVPGLGQSALYCVSEIHSVSDLKRLASAVKEVIG